MRLTTANYRSNILLALFTLFLGGATTTFGEMFVAGNNESCIVVSITCTFVYVCSLVVGSVQILRKQNLSYAFYMSVKG